nr:hypothetical protein [Tanacetum cinerariifolium]
MLSFDSYAYSDSLLLTPLCCDDIYDVTPRVSALAGCDRLVVWILLEGDEILRVQGERTQGVAKTLLNTKVVRISLDEILRVQGERTQGVAKTLLKTKLDEPKLSDTSVVQDFVDMFRKTLVDALSRKGRVKLRRVRAMSMTIQSSVKDKILATPIDTSKVENAPAEMLRDMDQQMEKRADDESEMDEAHASSKEWNSGDDQTQSEMDDLPRGLANATESVRDAIGFEDFSLTGLELVQETTDKVVLVKEKPKVARDHQKSYVDYRCKPLEFEVGAHVLLNVMPCKGVLRFRKKGLADANLYVPLDEIEADKTLHFVEETMGIMDREI